ncbi:hypothetical protein KIN20_006344 [Parelaphostrongylus tenuis]|uniref:Uncharacterized protein n=1 Tax=Parelaphostrongylus tenuis TaxID=148309 RepID=A0AAD5MMU6_PARTN|nr:hypothetical protein KIN20_006344 [Parelaphostrongylus tenuis]
MNDSDGTLNEGTLKPSPQGVPMARDGKITDAFNTTTAINTNYGSLVQDDPTQDAYDRYDYVRVLTTAFLPAKIRFRFAQEKQNKICITMLFSKIPLLIRLTGKVRLTEDYDLGADGLKPRAELTSVPQTKHSDRFSITTEELLENIRKVKLDPTVMHLTIVLRNISYRRSLREDVHRYRQKRLLEAA